MQVFVPKQSQAGETRVALTPQAIKKLIQRGVQVVVESGCGVAAHQPDDAYQQQGATVHTGDDGEAWGQADLIVTIHPPTAARIGLMRSGTVLLGMLNPFWRHEAVNALAERGVTAFSMELLPRISRAQAMDVLSSQANIAGYQAVILAAEACPKIFPMMITAAGTIAPTRVLVVGAGVAGLQAIATAKRLGAVVEAYDIRPEVAEQVQSLGARFLKLPSTREDVSTAGGYAKEQTDDERAQQQELMARHVLAADIVITTAAIFGRPPPILIDAEQVAAKLSGSVIVDLAADLDSGQGNCQLTQPGRRITTPQGVVIEGHANLPGLAPVHSSQVYANNMVAFCEQILDDGHLKLDLEDELQAGPLLTHAGQVASQQVVKAMSKVTEQSLA